MQKANIVEEWNIPVHKQSASMHTGRVGILPAQKDYNSLETIIYYLGKLEALVCYLGKLENSYVT